MLMMTTMMKKTTRPSVIHVLAALSLVLSFRSCACTELYGNISVADIRSYCPVGSLYHESFYECGDPAGRCLCKDHTAYCNVSSPALPVLPDDVYVLDLCTDDYEYFESLAVNKTYPQLTKQFFSNMKNVTELRIVQIDISPEAFVLLANVTTVYISCFWRLSQNYKSTLINFLLIPNLRSIIYYSCYKGIFQSLHPALQSPLQSFSAESFHRYYTLNLTVFQTSNYLKRISFTDCVIFDVLPAALPALEELILNNNKLTTFPQTCDVHNNSFFPSLKRIILSKNLISQIGGEGSATCLPQVTEIDVSYNQINRLERGVFDAQSCPKLETVNLGRSQRNYVLTDERSITADFTFSNPSIRTLNLTNSRWTFGLCTTFHCVEQNTFANSSLTHLILDGCDFIDVQSSRFCKLFGSLRNLTHLFVRNSNFFDTCSKIGTIRFCDLNLQYLDVSDMKCSECDMCVLFNCINCTIKTFIADKVGSTSYIYTMNERKPTSSCEEEYKIVLLRYGLMGSAIEHISFRENNLDFGIVCSYSNEPYCDIPASFENKPNLRVLLLDGNDFSKVDAARFVLLFGNLTNLENLSLSNCGIKHVSEEMFHSFPHMQYLDLSNNRINTLSSQTFSALPSLNVLHLHGNVLSVVPEGLFSSDQRRRMTKFTLYQNPLACSCNNRWLQSWLLSNPDLFDYASQSYSCFDDPTKSVANYTMPDQACMLGKEAAIAIIITSTVTIAALTAFSLMFRYRWNFRLLLNYALSGRPNYEGRRRNYVYDVFVSYDQHDFQWVRQQLMPQLEDRMGLRVCIHQRDFIPGHYIVTNITQAVEHSKKVLMVFSRHFVLSRWCQFEVDFCLSHAIENRDSLLIVCLDDVASDETLLTGAMKAALSTMTYIQWVKRRDAIHFFWERVGQSLRDVRPRDREAGRRRQREVLDPEGRVRIEMQVMDF